MVRPFDLSTFRPFDLSTFRPFAGRAEEAFGACEACDRVGGECVSIIVRETTVDDEVAAMALFADRLSQLRGGVL